MQAVCQLDEDDPQVAGHGEHELAEAFRVRFDAGPELHFVQLGDTVDQVSNFRSEFRFDVLPAEVCIFNRIVQYRGCDADMIHAQVGKNLGDGYRVKNIGFTGLAGLTPVGGFAKVIGSQHDGYVFRIKVRIQQVPELPGRVPDILLLPAWDLFRALASWYVAYGAKSSSSMRVSNASAASISAWMTSTRSGSTSPSAISLQCNYSRLVVLFFDQRICTMSNLASPFGRRQHHLETVVDPVETVFYSNSCHIMIPKIPV